jgi:hypothetical protein
MNDCMGNSSSEGYKTFKASVDELIPAGRHSITHCKGKFFEYHYPKIILALAYKRAIIRPCLLKRLEKKTGLDFFHTRRRPIQQKT